MARDAEGGQMTGEILDTLCQVSVIAENSHAPESLCPHT